MSEWLTGRPSRTQARARAQAQAQALRRRGRGRSAGAGAGPLCQAAPLRTSVSRSGRVQASPCKGFSTRMRLAYPRGPWPLEPCATTGSGLRARSPASGCSASRAMRRSPRAWRTTPRTAPTSMTPRFGAPTSSRLWSTRPTTTRRSGSRTTRRAVGGTGSSCPNGTRLPNRSPRASSIGRAVHRPPSSPTARRRSSCPTAIGAPDDPSLLALGAAAFARYPAQVAPYFSVALTSRAAAARYGLWVDEGRGVGGLVRARMADGSAAVSLTCSTCHSAASVSGADPGLPNRSLDIGAAILDAPGAVLDPAKATALAAWGPGRLDVTTSAGTEPVRIPDLRPVRWLTYLQQDATLHMRDLATLAIRIETLIITSNDQVLRPPRMISLALAAYLISLADTLPAPETAAADVTGGRARLRRGVRRLPRSPRLHRSARSAGDGRHRSGAGPLAGPRHRRVSRPVAARGGDARAAAPRRERCRRSTRCSIRRARRRRSRASCMAVAPWPDTRSASTSPPANERRSSLIFARFDLKRPLRARTMNRIYRRLLGIGALAFVVGHCGGSTTPDSAGPDGRAPPPASSVGSAAPPRVRMAAPSSSRRRRAATTSSIPLFSARAPPVRTARRPFRARTARKRRRALEPHCPVACHPMRAPSLVRPTSIARPMGAPRVAIVAGTSAASTGVWWTQTARAVGLCLRACTFLVPLAISALPRLAARTAIADQTGTARRAPSGAAGA